MEIELVKESSTKAIYEPAANHDIKVKKIDQEFAEAQKHDINRVKRQKMSIKLEAIKRLITHSFTYSLLKI